jgi:hypothetical protein
VRLPSGRTPAPALAQSLTRRTRMMEDLALSITLEKQ